jgi:ABC-type Zn uptake system ZnuABC Zn-binding protein ZnuA
MMTTIDARAILPLLLPLVLGPAAGAQDDAPPLQVATTLGVLADLARTVGGEHVAVDALASPEQDPHYVEPTPVLMNRARRAQVLVEVGLQLELWADKVAAGSGNPKVQLGQPGRVIASTGVSTLELPTVLSREWGDVHPYGNPHVWLDPLNAKVLARNLSRTFAKLDPAHAAAFEANLEAFERDVDERLFGAELVERVGARKLERLARSRRLDEYLEQRELTDMLGGWLARARPLRGRPIVSYHKTFAYLADRFGFTVPVEIEEKPGIPPSARHRDHVLQLMREQGVRTILQELFYDRSAADYLAKKTGARVVVVPIDVGAQVEVPHYVDLIDRLVGALVASETAADR